MPDEASHLHEPGGDFQCLHEFIPAARAKLSNHIWGYLVGAAESETTMAGADQVAPDVVRKFRACGGDELVQALKVTTPLVQVAGLHRALFSVPLGLVGAGIRRQAVGSARGGARRSSIGVSPSRESDCGAVAAGPGRDA